MVVSISGLFFVVTGVQYWLPTYAQLAFGVTPDIAAVSYSVISFTGPISGVIVGGILTTYCGGYNEPKGQLLQCICAILTILSAIPVPFCYCYKTFCVFIWLTLFFGGFILPPLTGIMLNTVAEEDKGSAMSLANLSYNLLGYLPAPTFYGLVSNLVKESSHVPIGALLYSQFLTICLGIYAIKLKLRNDGVTIIFNPMAEKASSGEEFKKRNSFKSTRPDNTAGDYLDVDPIDEIYAAATCSYKQSPSYRKLNV